MTPPPDPPDPPALPLKIKCVAPFAGGKRRLAPRIVELLGPHDLYVEPFVGGCSILPVKPRAPMEYLFDANPAVPVVLLTLADEGPALAERLRRVEFDRDTFHHARGYVAAAAAHLPVESAVEFAAQQLIVWWQGPGGVAGTTVKPWFATRHTNTGGHPATRWASFKASLPALSARLANTNPDCGDWVAGMAGGHGPDRPGVAYYIDPPYLTKSFAYQADFRPGDHEQLADVLNQFRHARVVVSYYDDGRGTLDRLYPKRRWRRVTVEGPKNMAAAVGRADRVVEVLLVNDKKGGR